MMEIIIQCVINYHWSRAPWLSLWCIYSQYNALLLRMICTFHLFQSLISKVQSVPDWDRSVIAMIAQHFSKLLYKDIRNVQWDIGCGPFYVNFLLKLGIDKYGSQGKNYTGAPGNFAPEMHKRALKKKAKKKAPENCHRLQCKSLFNVADLVNGMWKVAPENKNLIFGLMAVPSK